jgi:hypothetical protein
VSKTYRLFRDAIGEPDRDRRHTATSRNMQPSVASEKQRALAALTRRKGAAHYGHAGNSGSFLRDSYHSASSTRFHSPSLS